MKLWQHQNSDSCLSWMRGCQTWVLARKQMEGMEKPAQQHSSLALSVSRPLKTSRRRIEKESSNYKSKEPFLKRSNRLPIRSRQSKPSSRSLCKRKRLLIWLRGKSNTYVLFKLCRTAHQKLKHLRLYSINSNSNWPPARICTAMALQVTGYSRTSKICLLIRSHNTLHLLLET